MAKKANQSQTNVNKVKKQNAQSAGQGQYGAEFASETDVQQVKKQNQQAEAQKGKNAGNAGNYGTE